MQHNAHAKTNGRLDSSTTVLITGGSRGLGLVFADTYLRRGYSVAICSRTEVDLDDALTKLKSEHPDARLRAYVCDVSQTEQVKVMVAAIEKDLGPIDLLVNNAGWILSAPLESVTEDDFRKSIDSNLWSMIRTSLAVIPGMKERGHGKILNITSIGGVAPVPHMTAYTTAKFGAIGFSTGLTVELKRFGIQVTTAVPTLMRTGSYTHARFKGNHLAEMIWFTLASTLPVLSLSAEKAVARMVKASDRGARFVTVGLNARIAKIAFALLPNLVMSVMGVIERCLPKPSAQLTSTTESLPGEEVQRRTGRHPQTRAGRTAAKKWNELNPDQMH